VPIYDYRCSACDHLAELLLGRNDPPPQFCPSCGAEGTMRKAINAPTIHFKGSGWAKKDRSTAAAAASKSAANDTDGSGGKGDSSSGSKATGDGKGDAKGEPKSDAKAEPASKASESSSGSRPADER
jgi:putative FmdB family regulatory protein